MPGKKHLSLIILFLSGLVSLSLQTAPPVAKWIIMKGCSLQVNGSTNINTFNCAIADYSTPDTITLYGGPDSRTTLTLSGNINLDVQSFDCHNPVMTADLRKTLKADRFPKLQIRFLTLNKFPDLKQNPDAVKGLVDIGLAGTTHRFEVAYRFSSDAQKTVHLIGTRDVNFSDFNLIPPRKLGGMIRTDNRLKIEFHLRMKAVD